MSIEQRFADFICTLQAADVPADAQRVVRQVLLAATGAAVAGAGEDGIAALRELRNRAPSSSATTCPRPVRRSSTARCAVRSTTAMRWRRASTSARR
jgi:2-methylcitrate dehydratase PrpD